MNAAVSRLPAQVFLAYVSAKDWALIDRELFFPVSWTDGRKRCAEALLSVGNASDNPLM